MFRFEDNMVRVRQQNCSGFCKKKQKTKRYMFSLITQVFDALRVRTGCQRTLLTVFCSHLLLKQCDEIIPVSPVRSSTHLNRFTWS